MPSVGQQQQINAPVVVSNIGQQQSNEANATEANSMVAVVTNKSGQQQLDPHTSPVIHTNGRKATTMSKCGQQHQQQEHQQYELVSTLSFAEQQQHNATNSKALALPSKDAKQQQYTDAALITLEDRKLLDAIVSSKPVNSLNHSAFTAGRLAKDRNSIQGL